MPGNMKKDDYGAMFSNGPNRGASQGQQINEAIDAQRRMQAPQRGGGDGGPGYLYGGGNRIEDEMGDIADMLGQMEAGFGGFSADPVQWANGSLKRRMDPLRQIFELYKKKLGGGDEGNIRTKFKQGIASNDTRAPRSSQVQGGGSGAQSNINNFGNEPRAEQSGPLINFQSDYRLPPRETSDPYAPARDATIEAAIRYLKTINPHRL